MSLLNPKLIVYHVLLIRSTTGIYVLTLTRKYEIKAKVHNNNRSHSIYSLFVCRTGHRFSMDSKLIEKFTVSWIQVILRRSFSPGMANVIQ